MYILYTKDRQDGLVVDQYFLENFLKCTIPNVSQILTAAQIRGKFRVIVPLLELFPVMPPTICWRISSAFSILRVNPLPPKISVSVVPNKLFWRYPVSLALSIHIVSKDHPIRVIVVGAHHHDITPSHSRSGSDLIKIMYKWLSWGGPHTCDQTC